MRSSRNTTKRRQVPPEPRAAGAGTWHAGPGGQERRRGVHACNGRRCSARASAKVSCASSVYESTCVSCCEASCKAGESCTATKAGPSATRVGRAGAT